VPRRACLKNSGSLWLTNSGEWGPLRPV